MKKKKKYGFETIELKNHIRIDAKDLVKIIKSVAVNEDRITAENGDWEFESLSDIENNIQALKGEPRINIGHLSINLNSVSGPPTIIIHTSAIDRDSEDMEKYEIMAKKIKIELNQYKSFFANTLYRWVFIFITYISVAIILSFASNKLENYYLMLPIVRISILTTIFIAITIIVNYISGDGVVIYSNRDGFLKRNAEKIITGVLTIILIIQNLDIF